MIYYDSSDYQIRQSGNRNILTTLQVLTRIEYKDMKRVPQCSTLVPDSYRFMQDFWIYRLTDQREINITDKKRWKFTHEWNHDNNRQYDMDLVAELGQESMFACNIRCLRP
jgi:hypothetical protein